MRIMPYRPKGDALPKSPADYGMENFKEVTFESTDGISIAAWEIPGDEKKIAVVNHPLTCTRYGIVNGMDGVHVEFLKTVKHLNEDGYTVITYDQRCQGLSGGGLGACKKGEKEIACGVGATEWQDLEGCFKFIDSRDDLKDLPVALVTHCMGANAAILCWDKASGVMKNVKCQVAVQPTISYNMMKRATVMASGVDLAERVAEMAIATYGSEYCYVDALGLIPKVKVPVLFAQVRYDSLSWDRVTNDGKNDAELIYDACTSEKEIVWIGSTEEKPYGTDKRFEGYNYFGDQPQKLISFLAKYI